MLLGAAVKEKYWAGLQGAPAGLLAERRPLSFPLLCCVGWQPLKIGTVPLCGACLCLSSLTFVKSGLVFPSGATGRGCGKCPPRRGGLVRLRAPRGAELCHGSRCRMVSSCFFLPPAPRRRRGSISGLFVHAGSPSTGLRVPRLAACTPSLGGRKVPGMLGVTRSAGLWVLGAEPRAGSCQSCLQLSSTACSRALAPR